MSQQDIQQQIRGYLVTNYLPGEAGEKLQDDEDLLLVLNSLQLLRMVIEVESLFGITIENSEMDPENLGTVEKMAGFVCRKKSA